MHWLVREIVGRTTRRITRHWFSEFEARTRRCRETQHRVLFRKLRRNTASDFGRDHRFDRILTIADFRRQVPVADYSYYRPYIERVKAGDVAAMFGPGTTLHMFAMTSGTTSEPKFIPVTDEYLREYRYGWMLWGVRAFDGHPEIYRLKVLALASDWRSSFTDAGIPCGSISGLTAAGQKRIVRERYSVPSCLMRVRDIEAKYYTALRLSITWPVGMATAANPSTLVGLAKLGDAEKATLVRDLADGTLTTNFDVPTDVRQSVARRIRERHPQRVRELEQIIARTGHLFPKDYWPSLEVLSNWTGGSMRAYLRQYPQYWGTPPVRDIGLVASECRMTIPLEDGTAAGVLDVVHQYYEFIPESEIDCDNPIVLEAHELEPGENYFILLTTSGGLYRYNIYDLVRCVGHFNDTPMLEFLNKGSQFSSITGEKLSEHQVSCAVSRSLSELDLALKAFTLAPCWADPPYYSLFVEADDVPTSALGAQLAEAMDRHLMSENVEYENRRASRRLGPVTLRLLPHRAWEEYVNRRLAQSGGTAEQYKHPCLTAELDHARQLRAFGEVLPAPATRRKAA